VDCVYERAADGKCTCIRCGRPDIVGKSECELIFRRCTAPIGLGDLVKSAIETVAPGFAKRRRGCVPCANRRALLNELGKRITGAVMLSMWLAWAAAKWRDLSPYDD